MGLKKFRTSVTALILETLLVTNLGVPVFAQVNGRKTNSRDNYKNNLEHKKSIESWPKLVTTVITMFGTSAFLFYLFKSNNNSSSTTLKQDEKCEVTDVNKQNVYPTSAQDLASYAVEMFKLGMGRTLDKETNDFLETFKSNFFDCFSGNDLDENKFKEKLKHLDKSQFEELSTNVAKFRAEIRSKVSAHIDPQPNQATRLRTSKKRTDPIIKSISASEIDLLSRKIEKICKFTTGLASLTEDDQCRIVLLRSVFDECKNKEQIRRKLQTQQDINEIKKNVETIWPLTLPPTRLENLSPQNNLTNKTEKELVADLRAHYEKSDNNLYKKKNNFREMIRKARKTDDSLDLAFEEPFFEQKFHASYRNLNVNEICEEWGVGNPFSRGNKYNKGCKLEQKLKRILNRWFPKCTAEDGGKEVGIINYIFDDRFENLINGKKDSFSPQLLIKILYSFEKKAKELNIQPQDFNNPETKAKELNSQQTRLRTFWSGSKTALMSMARGCCVQVQKAINKIAEYYDVYQISSINIGLNEYELFDRKFCQVLREEATNKAVDQCPVSQNGGGSAPDYARLLKSFFTPLVNTADSGYHSEPSLSTYKETYQSLAIKWKDASSSFDLIKNILITLTSNTSLDLSEYEKTPMKFSEFISVVKSVDQDNDQFWINEIKKVRDAAAKEELTEDSNKLNQWINNSETTLTLFDLRYLIAVDLYGNKDVVDTSIYKLMLDDPVYRTIAYIFHLSDKKLIKINSTKSNI